MIPYINDYFLLWRENWIRTIFEFGWIRDLARGRFFDSVDSRSLISKHSYFKAQQS